MSGSAPWRALEEPEDGATGAPPGGLRPSVPLLALGAAAVLVIGSLAAVAFGQFGSGGQVQVIGGTGASGVSASLAMIVVQVTGAVMRPGVYTLPAGSRVGDAIRAAGGYSTDVDPEAAESKLNLAARLVDAQSIVVPRRGDAAGSGGAEASEGANGLINLNTATAAQLDTLPGIGPVTAAKIIASREERPFTSVDDLVTRKLVSASTLAKFRDQVTV